jgi:outer membrane protein
VQAVLRNSKAAVSIQTQIDARRDAYQSEVTEEERALREAEQDLAQRRAALDQSAYEQAARSFQDRVAEVQRTVQARKRELDEAFARAMNEVRQKMVATVAQVADERGYQVVLFKNQIVIAAKSLDISEEVQARLDFTLPKVDVDLPPLE